MMTVDFHQRCSSGTIQRVIALLADVKAPARAYADEQPDWTLDSTAEMCFTIGYLSSTVGSLLDALGFPEHGPNVNQWSWLPDDDNGVAP